MSNELQPEIHPVHILSWFSLLIDNDLQFALVIDEANKI